jgi:sulfate-transporting ATPase
MSELWQFAVIGLSAGGAYALVSLGIVAVYRGSGILNFSQGAIGMIAAYVFWEVHSGGAGSAASSPADLLNGAGTGGSGTGGLPVVPSLLIGLLTGAALGALFYGIVVRLLRNASAMAKVVATLGLMLLLESVAEWKWGTQTQLLPPLFGAGKVTVLGGVITDDTLTLLIVTLVLAVFLWVLFTRTRLGINATALRENPVAAAGIGISPHPTGFLTWTIGGAMAAFAGILLIPVIGLSPSALTLLVIPAMAAALVGRFELIWVTVVTGLLLGVLESVLQRYSVNSGIIASVPFAVIIVAVVLGGRALPGRGESLRVRLPRVGTGHVPWARVAAWVLAAVVISVFLSPTWATAVINSSVFGLLALSIVVVTGYAGQISIASAALAGFASFIAAHCSGDLDLPFIVCVLLGTAAAIVLGVIIGAPAVRVRGINLAIVTLGLSLAVENLVLDEPALTGRTNGLTVHSPGLFGLDLSPAAHPARFAIFCAVILALGSLAVWNIRRGESGRRYVAVRANERGAASVGISVPGAKLGAFAVSAALAGLSGALATFQFSVADFGGYDVFQSISALVFTVVGGVGYVGGSVFAAVSSPGGVVANIAMSVIHFATVNYWLSILTGLYVIYIMVRSPDGMILDMARQNQVLLKRVRLRRASARSATHRDARDADAAPAPSRLSPVRGGPAAGDVVLGAHDVSVSYGAVQAVRDVSFDLVAGRVLGVIGPNGAGKTSLIDALTGFARASGGTISLRGADVTRRPAHIRARKGIGRTFQNLELFDDLSVRENILTALDRRGLARYGTDLFRPGRRGLTSAASAAVAMLGLAGDLDTVVGDLPQGRRRMVAIARLVAAEPAAMMLDEPAAGLSGAERETAGRLFRALAADFGAAVLLVEHNVDVVADTCDELIVLNFGQVIAAGPTAEVLRDPVVREAYLGKLNSIPDSEAVANAEE